MPSIPAYVEPEMLTWARTSANLEPLAASRKIGVPEDRVEAWEKGDVRPTVAQLRKAATVYRRPLAAFYLPKPPQGFETLRDFRRLGPGESGEWSVALHAEFRRAHFQREALMDIAELEQEEPSRAWRVSPLLEPDERLASTARSHLLGLTEIRPPTASADEYAHLGYWTRALEDAGVLVMTTEGGLVSKDEMRGFSLFFDQVPVIMLNGAEFPRPRLFSLIHEYVHLLLHTEGLCDITTDQRAVSANRQLEARCNAVAAEVLMPRSAVLASALVQSHDQNMPWSLPDLLDLAKPFGVSAEAMLRRLVTLGSVPLAEYQSFREAQKGQATTKKKRPGGSFYNTKARNLGKGYVRVVAGAHRRSLIDTTTAAQYLDAKVGQIGRLSHVSGA